MLLDVTNLEVSYGAIKALHGLSLSIAAGEIVALIGSNGAGKTTLLRTISGLLRPASGGIAWGGNRGGAATGAGGAAADAGGAAGKAASISLTSLAPHNIVRLGISHVPEGRQVFPQHTVRENLLLGAYQRGDRREIEQGLDECYRLFPRLAERRQQKAGTLSGGEQQMLAIGRALMARPSLLLLDEPSLGLAPKIVKSIFEIIQSINARGTTIFLVEQNAHMALTIAQRGYVLQSGRVILSDKASALLQNDDVKKAYLGG